jgi:hypothetical protein
VGGENGGKIGNNNGRILEVDHATYALKRVAVVFFSPYLLVDVG